MLVKKTSKKLAFSKTFTYDLFLWICLLYWIIRMAQLLNLEDTQIHTKLSFSIYLIFILIHSVLLVLRYVFVDKALALKIVYSVSMLPALISGIFILLSMLSLIAYFT